MQSGPAAAVPMAIYLHFPWCLKRCPYCDFNAHASAAGEIPQQAYRQKMREEITRAAGALEGLPAPGTAFIGGGTPSLLQPDVLTELLAACRSELHLVPGGEVTLEANPGALESADPEDFLSAGVNRLSLGVQSFSDKYLKALGRIHSATEAEAAIDRALRAGFSRLNLDLMYGLPDQRPADALADLERALDSGVGHICWYRLTLEPNTRFFSEKPALPAEDDILRMEQLGAEMLHRAGFVHYETSAWCLPGQQCQHNLNYWTFGDYIGLGPGAHSKLSRPGAAVHRWAQLRHPSAWLQATAGATGVQQRELSQADLAFEFFLNALRLYPGPDADLLHRRTGLTPLWPPLAEALARARSQRFLHADTLHPTSRGRRYLDVLTEIFLL